MCDESLDVSDRIGGVLNEVLCVHTDVQLCCDFIRVSSIINMKTEKNMLCGTLKHKGLTFLCVSCHVAY